jgi:hypothetical protein
MYYLNGIGFVARDPSNACRGRCFLSRSGLNRLDHDQVAEHPVQSDHMIGVWDLRDASITSSYFALLNVSIPQGMICYLCLGSLIYSLASL